MLADLREEIYVELPEIIRDKLPGKCGLLLKTLYGLKQSPREWYQQVHDALIAAGFTKSYVDYSLFIKLTPEPIFLLLYVDNILFLPPSGNVIDQAKAVLSKHFDFVDEGIFSRYLDVDAIYRDDAIYLSQRSYLESVFKRFGIQNIHSVATLYNEKVILVARADGMATPTPTK